MEADINTWTVVKLTLELLGFTIYIGLYTFMNQKMIFCLIKLISPLLSGTLTAFFKSLCDCLISY